MRTTGTNSQVAHVWANQSQPHMSSASMYSDGSKIYSYGSHYLAGEVHDHIKSNNGCKTPRRYRSKFALIRIDTYSPTTSNHLSLIESACAGLMPYFLVKGAESVSSPRLAVKDLDDKAKESISLELARVKVTQEWDIKEGLKSIHSRYDTANELRRLLGLTEKHPKQSDLDKVEKHLKARLARYHELNTPEQIEKKRIAKEKRELAKEKKLKLELAEKITKFRKGENVSLHGLKYDLLRIQGDEVVTSRGARVPLTDAKELLHLIKSGAYSPGHKIGNFSLDHFQNGTEIKIGCHKFLLSEAEAVLGQSRHLRLA